MFTHRVIEEIENEYGSFSVEELLYEGRWARVVFSGPMHTAQSGMPLEGDNGLLFDYNRRLLELALDLDVRQVLVLGGGTMTFPTALVSSLPKVEVKVIEINPDMLRLARKYFGFKPNPRINLEITDALAYMAKVEPIYDLVIVDLYNNFTIPEVFKKLPFARQLGRALKTDGIVAANCISAIAGEEALPLKQLVFSYANGIGPVRVVKAEGGFYDWSPQNLIVMAANAKTISPKLLGGCIEVSLPINNK